MAVHEPSSPSVHGVILAGGYSRRMRSDKALLRVGNRPQVLVMADLLTSLGMPTFISCREGQWDDPGILSQPLLYDRINDAGPLGGLLRAFDENPHVAWLVVACDLVCLDEANLRALLESRDPSRFATAFWNEEKSWPEPLCTIYEPAILPVLTAALGQGIRCPRRILMAEDIAVVRPKNPAILTNVNTPDDVAAVQQRFSESSAATD